MVAGQDGVAAPRRTKTVSPSYPQEALAQGVRGIVILEILIDPQGKVKSAEVIRSIPLLDEAALSAVRNWEYEVTKVDGTPVSVRLTVPITFALKIPEVTRAPGIPELRQGASVQFPPGQTTSSSVAADVTLAPDGQVAEAQVLEGSDPWTAALLSALRTWRFAAEGDNVILSFRVDADFLARGDKPKVEIRLSELRRSEAIPRRLPTQRRRERLRLPVGPDELRPLRSRHPDPRRRRLHLRHLQPRSLPPPAPVGPAPPVTTPPTTLAPPPAAPAPVRLPADSAPRDRAPDDRGPASDHGAALNHGTTTLDRAGPRSAHAGGTASRSALAHGSPARRTTSAEPKTQAPTAPPVEVITAPRPPEAQAPPPQPGVSAIRDVTLALGVPDLVRGRRPVPPPLARMSGRPAAST